MWNSLVCACLWCGSLLRCGSLELVGEHAGFVTHQLGTGAVARLDRLPVVDLQSDVPLAQRDVLSLQDKPVLLRCEQLDLSASRRRTQLAVRYVPPHVTDGHAGRGQ